MEKQKLLIVGALIFAVGLGTGYLVSRYAFNAQFNESGAATKACTGTPDPEIAVQCSSLATKNLCVAAGCKWNTVAVIVPSPIGILRSSSPK